MYENGTEEDLINERIANYMFRLKNGEKPFKAGILTLRYEEASMSLSVKAFEDRFDPCIVSKLFLGAFGMNGLRDLLLIWFDDCRTKVELEFECNNKFSKIKVFGKAWEKEKEDIKEAATERNRGKPEETKYGYNEFYAYNVIPTFVIMCNKLIEQFEE